MDQDKARKAFFIALALAAFFLILKDPATELAAGIVSLFDLFQGNYARAWQDHAERFVEDGWALAICVLAMIYFGYQFIVKRKP